MRCFSLLSLFALWPSVLAAQSFEVVRDDGRVTARIEVISGAMRIVEQSGQRFLYLRDSHYDSMDGRWIGYFHPDLNRVLRFPRSGRGTMMMADLDDAVPRFREMDRTVRPAIRTPLPPDGGWWHGGGFGLPIYPGFGPIVSPPIAMPPGFLRPPLNPSLAQSVVIDSQIVARPALAPVDLQLRNSSHGDLIVTINDLANPSASRQRKIPAGETISERFSRQAGADKIVTYQVVSPFGDVTTKQVTQPLAPEVQYEMVVHQWQLQSIAIDRTGKSPNMIEDVNYQGRGMGRFQLPPGDQLQPVVIDVYRAAINSQNAGSVGPIIDQK